jgi:1-deoxy-D-xylulose-5-phosphate synthase
VNARFAKPLDTGAIISIARKCGRILTIEENSLAGGFGSSVIELLQENNIKARVERIGIPDEFIEHGSIEILKKKIGLDKEGIKKSIIQLMR